MKLSVVIPAYNERHTLGRVLVEVATVLPGVDKQIVIVDDCSVDGTRDWLQSNFPPERTMCGGVRLDDAGDMLFLDADASNEAGRLEFLVLYHERNRGKGGALQTGLSGSDGDVVVIQDADLEYDPRDWEKMLPLICDRQAADVVYGSRFYGAPHRSLYYHHYLANKLISFLFNALYNQTLKDVEVCYKMMRREVVDSLRLSSNDFGIEIQISAQIALARRWRIYEVGIMYFGRTYAEGKKINWKDGMKALWYLLKYRFSPT